MNLSVRAFKRRKEKNYSEFQEAIMFANAFIDWIIVVVWFKTKYTDTHMVQQHTFCLFVYEDEKTYFSFFFTKWKFFSLLHLKEYKNASGLSCLSFLSCLNCLLIKYLIFNQLYAFRRYIQCLRTCEKDFVIIKRK